MDMNRMTLLPEEYEEILRIKRDLHMHPELSKKEFRTTGLIRAFLEKLPGVELLDTGTPTGVLARISGDGSGTEIALRADIDALPQNEQYESPWKSRIDGVMHACGHDFHTASLLGAALILTRMKAQGELANNVDLIFQPAEEGTTGARALIDAGLFERIHPCAIFGIHNWPSVESGRIVVHEGALMSAKRNMTIRIRGRGGHGSMPHLNVDPIVCAAAVVQSLQTIVSRNTNPMEALVLSISRIEGGSPVNRVADQVEMNATERKLYDQLKHDLIIPLEDGDIDAANAASLSNKLLQMANGAVYDENKEARVIHQRKLEMLEDLIESANGQPVLIGYWFKHDRTRIIEHLTACGYAPRDIKDSSDITNWNNGSIPVALIHPASAGHGLNIQSGGHILIWFGLTWSLELYQQTNARLWRQGQQNTVTIHHIVTKDTVDEDVLKALASKDVTQEKLIAAVKARL